MVRGISLHIGLNRVDPAHYDGWNGKLTACEFDAQDMKAIAESGGFTTRSLITEDATAEAILTAISEAADELASGDLFLCTYSGHGGQVPDRNNEGEDDRSDETWVAFDRQIVDDELYAQWAKFAAGVRVFVLSDSCHSGTVVKEIYADVPDPVATREEADAQSPRYRALPRDVMIANYRANAELYDDIQKRLPGAEKVVPQATVLLISGCKDDQLSLDGFSNGLFTENLRAVWDDGAWEGGYPEFRETIRARMPARQQPNYFVVGAADPDFEQQKPFTIG